MCELLLVYLIFDLHSMKPAIAILHSKVSPRSLISKPAFDLLPVQTDSQHNHQTLLDKLFIPLEHGLLIRYVLLLSIGSVLF